MTTEVFVDTKDRNWSLGITFGDVKRVKTLTGINLAKPGRQLPKDTDIESLEELPEEQQPVYFRLANDPVLLIDVLFALVEPQAKAHGVSSEEFGQSISTKLFQDLSKKFWEVYHSFFLEMGDVMNGKLIEQVKRARKEVEKQADRVGDLLDKAVEQKLEEAIKEIETTLQ